MRALAVVVMLPLLSFATGAAAPTSGGAGVPADVDVSQAELMLSVLERAADGSVDEGLVDRVMREPGTALVVQQMNLMRRVTPDQYRTLLLGLDGTEPPSIEPVDGSERARRGVEGLTREVWKVLRWGVAHTGLIRERVEEARTLRVSERARQRAMRFLPDGCEVDADTHVVLGGRAGAAALGGGQIYVDLLLLSFRAARGGDAYVPERDLVAFFAHEMHHVGYVPLLRERRRALRLEPGEELAWEVLASLLAEGSATYLVSYERDLGRMRTEDQWSGLLAGGDELLANCEHVLTAALRGEIASRDELDAATPFLLGSGAHAAGSLMLSAIDAHGGIDAVMAVMRNPRTVLLAYDAAVAASSSATVRHRFAPALAEAVSRMGSPPQAD